MKLINNGILLFVMLTLWGCSSSGIGASQYAAEIPPEDMKHVVLIRIPASDNPISNGLVVSLLNLGVVNPSVNVIKRALQTKGSKIAIIGKSPAVNVATLKAGLRSFVAMEDLGVIIYFIAPKKYQADLLTLAESKKVKLIYKVSN